MSIAEQKRQNNIAEYIVHMYQTEDLIRAYRFDLDEINRRIVNHIPSNDEDKKALSQWYSDIIDQMKSQGIEKSGHLHEVQQIVEELSDMYEELQNTDSSFEKICMKSKPHIEKNKSIAKDQIISEIQICLNGIYGLLLLRMEGKKVADELMASINSFGDILSYLSFKYKQKHFMSKN